MDLTQIKTATGKAIQDFKIPEELIKQDAELVHLIMRSESMNDDERQYWFNLWEVMNHEQREKLRDILTRERQKLAEIDKKYGKIKEDPAVIAKRAQEEAIKRAQKQQELREREAKARAQSGEAEDILDALDEI